MEEQNAPPNEQLVEPTDDAFMGQALQLAQQMLLTQMNAVKEGMTDDLRIGLMATVLLMAQLIHHMYEPQAHEQVMNELHELLKEFVENLFLETSDAG